MSRQEELDALQKTLNHAIDALREELVAADLPPLSLQATEPHPLDEYSYLPSPRLYEARRLLLATVGQLKNLVEYPHEKACEESFSPYNRGALEAIIDTGVVDFLGGVPDRKRGAHVSEIQKALDINSRKLTIILRFLSTEGWVRETEEGVFALNRPGYELLQGKNGRKLVENVYIPEIASSLSDWLQHPEWKHSDSVVHTPIQMIHGTDLPLFQWLQTQPSAFRRMAETIRANGDAHNRGVIADYPWNSLEGRTIVDCGGGQGFLSIQLAKNFPSLRFVNQDLPQVIAITKDHLANEFPDPSDQGRVVAEVQDFFQPQSRRGNDYNYVFRYVLHDWADAEAIQILKNTAAATGPQSKVIIIETISTPSIIRSNDSAGDVHPSLNSLDNTSYQAIAAPPFIPANFGAAARAREVVVLHLLGLMNAQGRTVMNWKKVIEAAGLKIQRVVPLRSEVSVIECGLPETST
ncbi:hypothetical protein NM688_g3929 [Phlebia brevispora]|uniref:Uncharacterized protein n=1 Tax=Phlebia brevispora TaxID=194682 RepID=A0ACC1T427_9APHY|nr:hypothetical protein NM688_g3929 [Phlebia brevispora]